MTHPLKRNLTWMARMTLAADAGGEPGQEAAPAEPASAASKAGDAGAGDGGGGAPAGPTRPEWFPERLWDDGSAYQTKDGALDYDALGTALKADRDHNKGKVFKRKDDLSREVREEVEQERLNARPESPDKYALQVPEGVLPEELQLQLDENDPIVTEARQYAHDLGLSQEQFDGLMGLYAKAQLQNLPDTQAEAEKLGENADKRLERVESWMSQHLSDSARQTIADQFVSAGLVEVLEEVMELSGEPQFIQTEDGGYQEDITLDDIRKLQASEEYRRGDATTVKKVREGYRKLTTRRAQGR